MAGSAARFALGGGSREYLPAFVAVCCVVSLTLSAVLLPAMVGGGAGIEGDGLQGMRGGPGGQQPGAGGSSGSGEASASGESGGLGALNAGPEATVGGAISEDLRNQSTRPHFVVVSQRPSYWRTGAYDRYSGSGFERSPEMRRARPYDGAIGGPSAGGQPFTQVYRLERRASTLPAAWRPQLVDGDVVDRLSVTEQRGLRVAEPVRAGTYYRVQSVQGVREPSVLRRLPATYPDAIERRYTALPESVSPRVAEAATSIVEASGAEGPYERAAAIERWLEREKTYSLDATAAGEDIAERFIFEMDSGYCEYFATAMVVLLRTQGIPARYVVGYSTGDPVGEDRYVVRGMNAHAWVEVYFPEAGWVRFDPTPGRERISAEADAMARSGGGQVGEGGVDGSGDRGSAGGSGDGGSAAAEAYDHVEAGSPGETFSAGGSGGEAESGAGGRDGEDADGSTGATVEESSESGGSPGETGAEPSRSESGEQADDGSRPGAESATPGSGERPIEVVLLDDDPVPGEVVAVEVTRGDEAVEGASVWFNDEPVGRTNASGMVTGTVPYAASLEVRVEAGDPGVTAAWAPTGGVPAAFHVDLRGLQRVGGVGTAEQNATFALPTNVSITHEGELVPGRRATFTAAIHGVPVRGASVLVDGRRVGTTDEAGSVELAIPFERALTVAVERDSVAGNVTVEPVTAVDVEVTDPSPGERATVRASLAGEPLPRAEVTVGGDAGGTTGPNGTVAFDVPFVDPLVVTAARGAASGSTTVDLPNMTAAVDPAVLPFAAAGFPVSVTARVGVEPVDDAAVVVSGAEHGRTGPDGSVGVNLPLANAATVTVEKGSMSATARLSWLFGPYVALLAAIGVAAFVRRRLGGRASARAVLAAAIGVARRVPRRVVGVLVALASGAEGLLYRVRLGLSRAIVTLRGLLRRARALVPDVDALRSLLPRLRAQLALLTAPRELADRLRAAIRAVVGRFRGRRTGGRTSPSGGGYPVGGRPGAGGDEAEGTRLTVREAWFELVGRVGVRGYRTMTPGEVAAVAERRGLAEEPVRELTDLFRTVEYGPGVGSRDHRERAERAIKRLREQYAGDPTDGGVA